MKNVICLCQLEGLDMDLFQPKHVLPGGKQFALKGEWGKESDWIRSMIVDYLKRGGGGVECWFTKMQHAVLYP